MKRILQFMFTVFPKSSIFIQPSKRAFYNPTFRYHNKICKCFTTVSSICQNFFEHRKIIPYITIKINHANCSFSIPYISCCNMDCMRKPQNVNTNMQLYTRFFFQASYPFSFAVSVFCMLLESIIIIVVFSLRFSFFRSSSTNLRKILSSTQTPFSSGCVHIS